MDEEAEDTDDDDSEELLDEELEGAELLGAVPPPPPLPQADSNNTMAAQAKNLLIIIVTPSIRRMCLFSSQAFEDLTLETSDIGQKQPIESMGARGNAFPKKLITKRKVEAFFPKIEVLGLREEGDR